MVSILLLNVWRKIMSKTINIAEKVEDIDGIHFSYRENHWIFRIDPRNYILYPVGKIQEGKNKGKWKIRDNRGKYFRNLKNMLPVMRLRGLSRFMEKEDIITLHQILKEIERFNEWCKDNFEIKVKGE